MIFGPCARSATALYMQVVGRVLRGSRAVVGSPSLHRRVGGGRVWCSGGARAAVSDGSGQDLADSARSEVESALRPVAVSEGGVWVVRVGAQAGSALRQAVNPVAESGPSESALRPGTLPGRWWIQWAESGPSESAPRSEPGGVVGKVCGLHVPGAQVPKPPRRTARAATRTCTLSTCSLQMARPAAQGNRTPFASPNGEQRVGWGRPSPPALSRPVGSPSGGHGRPPVEGVGDVPGSARGLPYPR